MLCPTPLHMAQRVLFGAPNHGALQTFADLDCFPRNPGREQGSTKDPLPVAAPAPPTCSGLGDGPSLVTSLELSGAGPEPAI